MPILVKDYTWSQTDKVVHIRIPLNPVSHEKVDLFPSDTYIKAHFSPFLFEVFLLHDVNIKNSKCFVKDDMIILDLIKREEIEWECLEKELSKADKKEIREAIIKKCQEEAQQQSEDRRIKKSELDRFAVQQAMEIDTQQHKLMDSRRDAARKDAMDALEEWRVNNTFDVQKCIKEAIKPERKEVVKDSYVIINQIDRNSQPEQNGVVITELPPDDDDKKKNSPKENVEKYNDKQKDSINEKKEKHESNTVVTQKATAKSSSAKKTSKPPVKTPIKSDYVENKKEQAAKRVLPRLRDTVNFEITHTPRSFPTPSRESQMAEEQAWLKNITLARRATGFVSEDLRPEEQDPQWCKDKGDEFFRAGNFLGAISAYSHGISLSDKLPSLYANRSATHFALGNFHKCATDCSIALDLMKPPCESNRRSRAKCMARRAAALARVGRLNKAIDEMKAAGKLLPEDESIKKDIYDMERAWEQDPDSD